MPDPAVVTLFTELAETPLEALTAATAFSTLLAEQLTLAEAERRAATVVMGPLTADAVVDAVAAAVAAAGK